MAAARASAERTREEAQSIAIKVESRRSSKESASAALLRVQSQLAHLTKRQEELSGEIRAASEPRRTDEETLVAKLDERLLETRPDPVFGVHVPVSCPDVPSEVLQPRSTWKNVKTYDEKAQHLAGLFRENFKQFESGVTDEVKASGPLTSGQAA